MSSARSGKTVPTPTAPPAAVLDLAKSSSESFGRRANTNQNSSLVIASSREFEPSDDVLVVRCCIEDDRQVPTPSRSRTLYDHQLAENNNCGDGQRRCEEGTGYTNGDGTLKSFLPELSKCCRSGPIVKLSSSVRLGWNEATVCVTALPQAGGMARIILSSLVATGVPMFHASAPCESSWRETSISVKMASRMCGFSWSQWSAM